MSAGEQTEAAIDFDAVVRSWRSDATLVAAAPLVGGVSASVHRLTVDTAGERRDVVYRSHASIDWKGLDDGVTAREFALMEALYAADLPVPAPLHLDLSGRAAPPFMLLAFVPGTTAPEQPSLPGRLRRQAALLARLHTAVVPDLPALPQRTAPGDDGPPARSGLSLLHGDYWAGNLQWRDGAIVAVFDWEDAAQGDPRSDLAGARLELTWSEGPDAVDVFTDAYLAERAAIASSATASSDAASLDAPASAAAASANAAPPLSTRSPLSSQPTLDPALAAWEVYCTEAALDSMHHWGLPAEQEADYRARAEPFLARARRRAGGPG